MRRTKLASRYAKAFFEFAQEYNQVERISKDFLLINKVFQENKNLQTVINSPIVRVDKKINIIREVFQQHIIDITLKYLLLILRKGRELHLDIICDEYVKLYKKYK
ncbi:MAG TPA: ATP synthase F1 subunit delta, partial [Bacteroidales bacterium]|nr:ATP synthase F1 subunit delta [Bacteroidales bacterium]